MKELLEKLLDDTWDRKNLSEIYLSKEEWLHTGEWGFIDLQGKKDQVNKNHTMYATKYLRKYKKAIPKYEEGIIAKFLDLSGFVRYYIENVETGFSIVRPVNSSQLRTMRQLGKGQKEVFFDILDIQGESLDYGSYGTYGTGFNKLVSHLKKMDLLENTNVEESSIDFPQPDLDKAVWDKSEDGTYMIKPEVKKKILDVLGKYPDIDIIDVAAAGESKAATIRIVGSLGTTQYTDDADVDVHVVISKDSDFHGDEEVQVAVIHWFNDHRDEIDGWIEKHPIEVYLQYDPKQDLMSDSVYDMLADKWLVGPKIVPMSVDPYDDFSHIADDIRDTVQDADVLFGELKRDLIDYTVIYRAMDKMSGEDKKHLLAKLKTKLQELEDNIEALYAKRKEWLDARKYADKPTTPEQALKDVELAKSWKDVNATFKFINRYQYFKIIGDLEELLADDEISPDEVDTIKGIIGVK